MDTFVRRTLLVATFLVPLLILPGIEFGYDLPKVVGAAIVAALVVAPGFALLPYWWPHVARTAQVVVAASGGLLLWLAVATFRSDAPTLSVLGNDTRLVGFALIAASVVLVIAVPVAVSADTDVDRYLDVLVVMLLVFCGYGLLQAIGVDPLEPDSAVGDLPLTFVGNINFTGSIACLGAPLGAHLVDQHGTRRRIGILLIAATVLTLYLASSRLGTGAAVVGAATYLLVRHWRGGTAIRGWLVALAPVGGLVAGLAAVVAGYLMGDRNSIFRMSYWGAVLEMVRTHPLGGIGLGRFGAYYNEFEPPFSVRANNTDIHADSSHAFVLDIIATVGIPGGLLLIAVLVAVGLHLRRSWLEAEGPDRSRITALTALLATHGVQSSISVPTAPAVWLGWLLIGLAISVPVAGPRRRRARRKRAGGRRRSRDRKEAVQTVAAVTATVIVVVGVVVIGGRTVMSAADMRGAAVLGQQDAQVAIPIAERATERTPWWPDAWLSLSLAHTRAGDAEAARAAALEAYERDANRRREAVRVLASLETTLDDLEEAERWQRRSLELDSYGFDRRFAVVDWALENDREELTVDTLDELERVLTPQMPQWERLEERRDSYLEASGEPT